MKAKDFEELKESVKEGAGLLKVSDDRLEELIAVYGFLVQKTLPLDGGDVEINREYMDALKAFEELQSLRKELAEFKAYKEMMSALENELLEADELYKALLEDGERLMYWVNAFADITGGAKYDLKNNIEQHNDLMERIEKGNG